MEDIKVGEYVRTKNGKIDKVKNDDYYMKQYIECEKGLYLRENITKHSFNLIDLLEVGDIVFIQDVLNNDFVYIYDDEMLKAVKENIEMGLEITEVLTHELYEANAYKVKGEWLWLLKQNMKLGKECG